MVVNMASLDFISDLDSQIYKHVFSVKHSSPDLLRVLIFAGIFLNVESVLLKQKSSCMNALTKKKIC